MIKSLATAIVVICSITTIVSQTKIPVFVSGEDGHGSYRIPAIIGLPNGDLLAIAEGRVKSAADFGDINLVMKRSTDKGKTWSAMEVLVDNASLPPNLLTLFSRYALCEIDSSARRSFGKWPGNHFQ